MNIHTNVIVIVEMVLLLTMLMLNVIFMIQIIKCFEWSSRCDITRSRRTKCSWGWFFFFLSIDWWNDLVSCWVLMKSTWWHTTRWSAMWNSRVIRICCAAWRRSFNVLFSPSDMMTFDPLSRRAYLTWQLFPTTHTRQCFSHIILIFIGTNLCGRQMN